MRTNLVLVLGFAILFLPVSISAKNTGGVFSTWKGFEPDKCASIWLIKRFIDKAATIKFFPKGEFIMEGIPFDTPDAKLRRYHNMSTFESMLKHFNINNPRVIHIGKIIHDMEVNTWEKKVFNDTLAVQNKINQIIRDSRNSSEVIEKSCKYFDLFYEQVVSPEDLRSDIK